MHKTVTSWPEFCAAWDGARNFMIDGLIDFDFDFPSLPEIVDQARSDSEARITLGQGHDQLQLDDIAEWFCALPIDVAMLEPFALAHFKLSRFDRPGGFLHGFKERVLDVWQAALAANGFTWDRCSPIIFISGPGCRTGYHMDVSQVMAWQLYGQKRFCGLRDAERWAPKDIRLSYKQETLIRPDKLTDDDALCYDMAFGDMLWNTLLTPHWVVAGDEASISINISHGGLRLNGHLAPFEAEHEAFCRDYPDKAPPSPSAMY